MQGLDEFLQGLPTSSMHEVNRYMNNDNNSKTISRQQLESLYNYSFSAVASYDSQTIDIGVQMFLEIVDIHHISYLKNLKQFCVGRRNQLVFSTNLKTVGKIISWLANDHFPSMYQDEEEQPVFARELFFWSILHNRKNLALCFWARLDSDFIAYGLTASHMMRKLANKMEKHCTMLKFSDALREDAREFENRATMILTKCVEIKPYDARLLLWKNLPNFGNQTLLTQAFCCRQMEFIVEDCCQNSLTTAWYGMISQRPPHLLIFLATFVPMPFLMFVKMKEICIYAEETPIFVKCLNGECSFIQLWISKCCNFYNATVTKFFTHCFSYMIFLVLFSYFVMSDLHSYQSWTEWVIWVWALTMWLDEFRQLGSAKIPTITPDFYHSKGRFLLEILSHKLRDYFRSPWNRYDQTVFISLFIVVFSKANY